MCPDRHLKTADDVEVHLRSLITWHAGPGMSLSDVCRLAHGAYPTDVLAQARVMRELGNLDAGATLLSHAPAPLPKLEAARSQLPLPHPSDFEWRFSLDGCDVITTAVRGSVRSGDGRVAMLGTSGYAEFVAHAGQPFHAHLFELRPEACSVIETLGSVAVSVGDVAQTWRSFPAAFDCVVADPPWYPEVVKTFVRAAAGLLRDGGTLLLCAPGLTTRPGLPAERRDLLSIAATEGLILDQLLPRSIEYESPPFELSALRASGLDGFDPYWRCGDLFSFRRLPGVRAPVPAGSGQQLSIDGHWTEVRLGRARIRVNTNQTQPAVTDQALASVVSGNVLDSVSSRDPRRGLPNVWTTTNRVYATGDPERLLVALRAHTRDGIVRNEKYIAAAREVIEEDLYALRLFGIE